MKLLSSHIRTSLLLFAGLTLLVVLGGCRPASETSSSPLSDAPQAVTRHETPATERSEPTALPVTSSGQDNDNLLLGNPSAAASDANNRLIERPQFALSYNKSNGGPNWVAWHLEQKDLGRVGRGAFAPDLLLPPDSQIRPNDYRGSGYDRGHQCPSGDRTSSRENNDATFVMSNMLPQAPALNQQVWAKLENYCRDQVRAGNELYIVCGGMGSQGRIGDKINVPQACWKIIVVLPQGGNDLGRINEQTRVIAVSMPNQDTPEVGGARWNSFITNAAAIESATGYKFFSGLPDATRQALEQKTDSGRAPRGGGRSVDEPSAPQAPVVTETSDPTIEIPPPPFTSPQENAPSVSPGASSEQPASPAQQATGGQVWVNTKSGVYHYPGTRWYGNTKQGEYMSEKDALAAGYHAAGNGQ
ncbi:nuclease [Abditibacteriota bacterium]|nr:nuclease [Abditibacteriota bacterium]